MCGEYSKHIMNLEFNLIVLGIFIFHSVIILSAQCSGEFYIRPNQGDHKDRPYEKAMKSQIESPPKGALI